MPFVKREIALNNGPPWGFRLYDDRQQGLIVHKIRHFSPAFDAKLKEGDVLLSVNGVSMRGIRHADAVDMIDFTFNTLILFVGRYESVHSKTVTFVEHRGEIQNAAVSKIQVNLQREPMTNPASPDLVPVPISKLMKEYDIPPRPDVALQKKRYANSEFFDSNGIHYPTVEEKIEMAKKMADSLTAPVNQFSKGAHIFEKQRARIDKYVKEGPDPVAESELEAMMPLSPDKIQPPPPPPFPPIGFPGIPDISRNYNNFDYIAPAPPPPPPPGAPKTLKEYLEKVKTFPKVQHDAIGPEKCFQIASALHNGQDRGSLIFMRNRQKSHKWEHTNEQKLQQQQQQQQQQHYQPTVTSSKTITTTTTVIENRSNKPKIPSKLTSRNKIDYTKTSEISSNIPMEPVKWRPIKFKVPAKA